MDKMFKVQRVMFNQVVIAYEYEGAVHCLPCSRKRFGKRLGMKGVVDKEGNVVLPIFSGDKDYEDLFCDECAEDLNE